MQAHTLILFRRNLRVRDNPALALAASRGLPLVGIRQDAPSENVNRSAFVRGAAASLANALAAVGIPLLSVSDGVAPLLDAAARYGAAEIVADRLFGEDEAAADNRLWHALADKGVAFTRTDCATALRGADVLTAHGMPHIRAAAFCRDWHTAFDRRPMPSENAAADFAALQRQCALRPAPPPMPDGDFEAEAWRLWRRFVTEKSARYMVLHDVPAQKGTSGLGAYIANGCISPRLLAEEARSAAADAWADRLALRDFCLQFAAHRGRTRLPHDASVFSPSENAALLDAWRRGETGFPLADAAMRRLNAVGNLHPALQRYVAELLCRTLLQPPQHGASWFAARLAEADEAVNRTNWLAAAGLDETQPQPFNPIANAQRLDPDGTFVRRHLPQLAHLPADIIHAPHTAAHNINTNGYPPPVADWRQQRKRYAALFQT